jgi:hypothetical protein
LVITADHVIEAFRLQDDNQPDPAAWRFRFPSDEEEALRSSLGDLPDDNAYYLADHWLVDRERQANFALLLLDGRPGVDKPYGMKQQRGWLRAGRAEELRPGDPLFILGYAFGRSLQLSYATFQELDEERVRYDRGGLRAPGSSGAPLFNAKWEVIAIHYATRPANYQQQMKLPDGEARHLLAGFGEAARLEPILARPQVKLALALSDERPSRHRAARVAV